jgi:hypothetical protein
MTARTALIRLHASDPKEDKVGSTPSLVREAAGHVIAGERPGQGT